MESKKEMGREFSGAGGLCCRKNYAIEAFTLLSQYHFLYSKRQAQQLLWGRFVNTHGLPARNIPCDLYMEHLNRVCKDAVNGLHANKTPDTLEKL